MLQLKRIIETALYVEDLTAAKNFYYKTLHLEVMVESDVLIAFNVGDLNTLLLFKRGASLETKYLSGGEIPPHDAHGRIHVCFAIDADDMPRWKTKPGRQRRGHRRPHAMAQGRFEHLFPRPGP